MRKITTSLICILLWMMGLWFWQVGSLPFWRLVVGTVAISVAVVLSVNSQDKADQKDMKDKKGDEDAIS